MIRASRHGDRRGERGLGGGSPGRDRRPERGRVEIPDRRTDPAPSGALYGAIEFLKDDARTWPIPGPTDFDRLTPTYPRCSPTRLPLAANWPSPSYHQPGFTLPAVSSPAERVRDGDPRRRHDRLQFHVHRTPLRPSGHPPSAACEGQGCVRASSLATFFFVPLDLLVRRA